MTNTAPTLLPTITTPLAAIEPTRLKDNVDCLRLIIGEFTVDHEGNPVLSTEQKQLLIAAQFAKALAGNEALLIHLGSTMAGQSKTEKIQHEAVVPLKQYSREQLLVMLGDKLGIHKRKNELDVEATPVEKLHDAVAVTEPGSRTPPVRMVGYREIRDQHSQPVNTDQLRNPSPWQPGQPLPPEATPVALLSHDELLQMHRKLQKKHGPKSDQDD